MKKNEFVISLASKVETRHGYAACSPPKSTGVVDCPLPCPNLWKPWDPKNPLTQETSTTLWDFFPHNQRWRLLHPRRWDFLLPPDGNNQFTTHRLCHIGNQLALALLRFPRALSKPPAPARWHAAFALPVQPQKKWESFLFFVLLFNLFLMDFLNLFNVRFP